MSQKERTKRYLAKAKGKAAIARKRANQKAKRQAASAANPKPRRKHVARAPKPPQPEPLRDKFGIRLPERTQAPTLSSTLEQSTMHNKAIKIVDEVIDDLLMCERQGEIHKLIFWLGHEYGFTMFEKPTEVSKEILSERQTKLAQAESEEKWWQEIDARVSQDWDACKEKGERLVDTVLTKLRTLAEAEPELKRRRKAFEQSIPKPGVRTPEARKLDKKVRVVERRDVQLMDFITKRLVTHAFLLAKRKTPDR